jgi:hypothetical protein
MKKQFCIFIFLVAGLFSSAQQVSLETLRKEYHNLNTDSSACAKLYSKISAANPSDNLITGYKGAITAAMANFAKAKSEKIKLFNSGKKLLEQAITTDSLNAELRFLRFTIQANAPKALGYHGKLENDKNYIIAHFDQIKNPTVKGRISEYFLSSDKLTEEEKKKLKNSGK